MLTSASASLNSCKSSIPSNIFSLLEKKGFLDLRPSQVKSIKAGLFENKNLLVCTPTASGKTLVAELAALNSILNHHKKALYVVPLRALASEKYRQFKKEYPHLKIGISSGEKDSNDSYLEKFDLIVLTSEKLDSLLRHHTPWMSSVDTLIVDEIHLLGDQSRGPTLEVVITLLRSTIKTLQVIGLSATIGNAKEIADWLDAELVEDRWRPTTLHQGVIVDNTIVYKK
jgi:helicase